MTRYFALLALVLILSPSMPALGAELNGEVQGSIVNGTTDGSSVAGIDVTLVTYLNEAELATTTVQTSADGKFALGDLSTGSDHSYQLKTHFQGVEYYSERFAFGPQETSKAVELIVYDSTTSDAAIRIEMAHTILSLAESTLLVEEYFLFVNESDRTYIGVEEASATNRRTLRFSLPQGVSNFEIIFGLTGLGIMDITDGFVDTLPVLPGGKEVAYSYQVKYDSGTYTYSRNVNYAMGRYDFLFQDENLEITSDQLVEDESLFIRDNWFSHFSVSDLTADDMLVLQISGLPISDRQHSNLWVAPLLIVLLAGASLVYILRNRRLKSVGGKDIE